MSEVRHRLVFGDDGSEAADVAWLWINQHDWADWKITVVTADFDVARYVPVPPERAELHPWQPPTPRRLLGRQGRVDVAHLQAEADPRVVLSGCGDAALMVIGHRGRGMLKALTIGSTADWLLHRPPTPLAIIRTARPARRVVLCVDGSAHARAATWALASMPWIAGLRVLVLSVADGRTRPGPAIEEAAEILRAAGAEPVPRRRESLSHSISFNVRSTIQESIDREDPDLVVLGTRGIGLGQRMLRGSVAADVAHHASCSILVAQERDPERRTSADDRGGTDDAANAADGDSEGLLA